MEMPRRSRRRIGAGLPPQTVSAVSGTSSTKTPELVVSLEGSDPLCDPVANAATQAIVGTSPCTSTKDSVLRSATASQVRSKSDMSCPDRRVHGRRGRGRLQDGRGGVEDGVLTVLECAGQDPHLLHPGAGDVADPLAHGVHRAGDVGQLDHELVDGHARLTLEHLEPDHVAVDGADLGRHRPQHAGSVGQPDAHAGEHAQWVLVMCTLTFMVCSALPA